MTDKELIQALKHCGDPDEATCYGCPARKMCRANPGLPIDRMAADRLEALLAEVAEMEVEVQKQICKRSDSEREIGRLEDECDHFRDLTKMVPQWVSVDERLPNTENQVLVTFTGKIQKREYVGGYLLAEYVPGEGWILEEYPQLENPNVTYWCYLPEPPSTEGVE